MSNSAPVPPITPDTVELSRERPQVRMRSTVGGAVLPVAGIGYADELQLTPEAGSYENGWGFFEPGESLDPKEFTLTQDDGLYVDTKLLGIDRAGEFSSVDRTMPLSPVRRKIAEEGICRAIEAKWQLAPGTLKGIRHARRYLQSAAEHTPNYGRNSSAIHFQMIAMIPERGVSLADHAAHHGDFLHFGRATFKHDRSPDKLDAIMRVYVHTPPEFTGQVAAATITAVRDKIGKEVYLKLDDCSTQDEYKSRTDNLIIYAQTHSELVVIAELLKKQAAAHPEMFDPQANPIDFARATSIPGVSLAEEPPAGEILESFTSSRESIMQAATKNLYARFLSMNPKLVSKYGVSSSDVKYFPDKKGADIMREVYQSMTPEKKSEFRARLILALRQEAMQLLHLYKVSPRNFAVNDKVAVTSTS